jgi:peroxiredoxin
MIEAETLWGERERMPKVELDGQAPGFNLSDFRGDPVRLADFRGRQHVVLVFNRGFM